MNRLSLPLLLLGALGLGGCAVSEEEAAESDALLNARILFKNYSGAYANADYGAAGAIRNDFRRLNAESGRLLLAALQSKNEADQGYAAFALGFSENRIAIDPLVAATRHPNETVRGNAIVALGNLGFPDVPAEPFLRLMKDPLPRVRQASLFGLALLPVDKDPREFQAPVQECLGDSDWSVRNEALIVLRKMKRPDSVQVILKGPVKDREPQVRASAALAIGAVGREAREATPFLIEMLKDESHLVVDGAWSALNHIHDRDFDRSYSTWRDFYEDELKMTYSCPDHRDVAEAAPGKCPRCGRPLDRMVRDVLKKGEPAEPPFSGLYVCPDHPETVTTTPAVCGVPGCGKELVPKKPAPVLYSCPDHPDNVTVGPSKCGRPGCGKDLVPKK
jgi:HEAT repeat protein